MFAVYRNKKQYNTDQRDHIICPFIHIALIGYIIFLYKEFKYHKYLTEAILPF